MCNPWKTKEPFQVALFDGIDLEDWKFLESMGLINVQNPLCSDDWKAEEPSSLNEPLVGLLL